MANQLSFRHRIKKHLKHVLNNGNFTSFQDLIDAFSLSPNQYYSYLQLKTLNFPGNATLTPPHVVSKTYQHLLSINPTISLAFQKCDTDLNISTAHDNDYWKQICRWFDPWCGHDKICTAVGPLSKALNPTLLQGVCLLLSLINCKSLWIKNVS